MSKRYEVRPDADRWVVWDTTADKVADDTSWRYSSRAYALDAAEALNKGER